MNLLKIKGQICPKAIAKNVKGQDIKKEGWKILKRRENKIEDII